MRHPAIRLEHPGEPAGGVQSFAPGRVNLIGEHTDYNDGLCLPFAIEQGIAVRAWPHERATIEARALDLGEADSFALDAAIEAPGPGRPGAPNGWRRFVRGAAAELLREGVQLAPAGSSSAARCRARPGSRPRPRCRSRCASASAP